MSFDAPLLCAIWPAVLPLPYSFVWFEPAVAFVHLLVEFEGLTPGFVVVFGGVVELSYLPPPWFVFELSLEVEAVEVDEVEAEVLWSALELELVCAEESCFACPGGVPWGLSARAMVTDHASAATIASTRARP